MDKIERFLATIERRPVDRPAAWLGMPTTDAMPALLAYFGVDDEEQLKRLLDDDVWPVEVPYHHPPANHIACAFDFTKKGDTDYEERSLTAPGFFDGKTDPACLDSFQWPDPAEHMSHGECLEAVEAAPGDYARLGIMWSAHFQDACSAFGMEDALMTMLTAPKMFQAVIDRITEFYLAANRIFYEAAQGKLHAVLIGNDFGSQTELMLSPDALRTFVFPGTRRLIAQAHSFGLKVIHHSCGAVSEVIPDLIELGADVIHPIQALATGMDAGRLARDFRDRVSFCGGVDVQRLLVQGTPDELAAEVARLRGLFPTGLVISPSHEAVLPDIPPENIAAIFRALR
ncbi:MAG: methyltransferase [Lentisphaerae bacterium]|jgi:uroporphyrinogen decarboxylase|nr:methyltransferase [Lentisphaerota bacterium]MBT4816641.1 methyltransferase [Lentisphaerota bacterium]MBT5610060.1 methyltransferase [Lentisphaerota bacterium]MBT7055540.1 methyltransferase [Lentisphaerota bacterium]MBT7841505.1 methyltransferase [Lentisphaerota bacterium]